MSETAGRFWGVVYFYSAILKMVQGAKSQKPVSPGPSMQDRQLAILMIECFIHGGIFKSIKVELSEL